MRFEFECECGSGDKIVVELEEDLGIVGVLGNLFGLKAKLQTMLNVNGTIVDRQTFKGGSLLVLNGKVKFLDGSEHFVEARIERNTFLADKCTVSVDHDPELTIEGKLE
jgi:hypothetical protein